MAIQIGPEAHNASDRARDWSSLMQNYGLCEEHNTALFSQAKNQQKPS